MSDFKELYDNVRLGLMKMNKLSEAYVHCHNCDWGQDDFWSSDYNPVRFLLNWEEDLLGERLDEPFTDDAGFIKEHGNLSVREVIARECEKAAASIRNMHFLSEEDWQTNNKCPKCGQALDID
jgi:hypothetical protein